MLPSENPEYRLRRDQKSKHAVELQMKEDTLEQLRGINESLSCLKSINAHLGDLVKILGMIERNMER